jgi:multicomponent Na+:H+ antiporter subunit E
MMKSLLARFVFFMSAWLMIAGWKREDIPIGLVASALALWVSLSLLPPTVVRIRAASLAKFNILFLSNSIFAGIDVSRRALLPRLNLRPGFATIPLTLSPGVIRNVFLLYQSLQPGTSPTSAESQVLEVHCLDVSQPIAEAIIEDEALLKKAIGHE